MADKYKGETSIYIAVGNVKIVSLQFILKNNDIVATVHDVLVNIDKSTCLHATQENNKSLLVR